MTLSRRALLATPALGLLPTGTAHAQGRTLTVGVVSDPVTLDPAFSASFFENQVLYNLHETLLVASPTGEISPGLASFTLRDPLTYDFTLKPNLTFHDGTPVDAAAAKANLERYMDPAGGSIRRSDLGPLTSVEVTGPLTITL
jgi:peptide/nickel transport system substrate-binding protein